MGGAAVGDDDQPVGTNAQRDVALAEFAALRTEVERRAGVQWNVYALQLGSAGAVGAIAIGSRSLIPLLLLIPASSYMLGMRYVLHDHHIKLIDEYIRDVLSPRLDGGLSWPSWKHDRTSGAATSRRRLTPEAWNLIHPTRLAFVGIGALAAIAAVVGGIADLATRNVAVVILVSYSLAVLIDVVAVAVLDLAFRRSA